MWRGDGIKKIKLSDIPVFQFFDATMAKTVNDCAQLVDKLAGQAVLIQGEPTPGMFVLIDGKVDVFLGREKVPTLSLPEGEVFGEMSLIDEAMASATIRASHGGAQLVFLHKETFSRKMEESPDLQRCFFRGAALVLTKRLRAANSATQELIDSHSSFSNIKENLKLMLKSVEESNQLLRRIERKDSSDSSDSQDFEELKERMIQQQQGLIALMNNLINVSQHFS